MSAMNENLAEKVERLSLAQPGAGGFWANIRIIRPVAWFFAVLSAVGIDIFMYFMLFRAAAHDHEHLPLAVQIFIGIITPFTLFAWILLDGYVYADAKRRGMRAVMWTLLSIFVPYMIGVILYFLLREPLPTPCPKCGFMARRRFAYCPQCSTPLNRVCTSCLRNLEYGWSACAYCGTPVAGPVAQKGATS